MLTKHASASNSQPSYPSSSDPSASSSWVIRTSFQQQHSARIQSKLTSAAHSLRDCCRVATKRPCSKFSTECTQASENSHQSSSMTTKFPTTSQSQEENSLLLCKHWLSCSKLGSYSSILKIHERLLMIDRNATWMKQNSRNSWLSSLLSIAPRLGL